MNKDIIKAINWHNLANRTGFGPNLIRAIQINALEWAWENLKELDSKGDYIIYTKKEELKRQLSDFS